MAMGTSPIAQDLPGAEPDFVYWSMAAFIFLRNSKPLSSSLPLMRITLVTTL